MSCLQKLIVGLFLISLLPVSLKSQTGNRVYKKFTDKEFKVGDIILVPQILFELSSCDILPQSKDSVNVIADFIKKHPKFVIEIGVHTDTRGDATANMKLSGCRAEAIFNYLTKELLLPVHNFKTKGYGDSEPIIPDNRIKGKTTEEKENLHAKNRRVEIKILQVG